MRHTALSASIFIGWLATTAAARAEEPAAPTTPPGDDVSKGQRGWLSDASVGRPILRSGEAKFVASGLLGYRWKQIELSLSGSVNQYSTASNNVFNNTSRAGWRLDGAYVAGSPGDTFRLLVMVDLSQALYLTRYRKLPEIPDIDPGNLSLSFDLNIKNEDSNMIRNSALVGFLLAPSPRTQARVALGLGLQGEIYLMTMFRHDDSGTEAAFDADLSLSIRHLGQAALRHQLFPGTLAVRLLNDTSRFQMSRSSAAIKIDFSDPSFKPDIKLFTFTQLESTTRLALDVEKLGFVGLMPSIFCGVDVSLLRGDLGDATAIVPVLGVGLTNGRL